jgi:hypothetical protein
MIWANNAQWPSSRAGRISGLTLAVPSLSRPFAALFWRDGGVTETFCCIDRGGGFFLSPTASVEGDWEVLTVWLTSGVVYTGLVKCQVTT